MSDRRKCKHCGLKVKRTSGSWGWMHDSSNKDIMTSCMLAPDENGKTYRAEPVDEGVAVVVYER